MHSTFRTLVASFIGIASSLPLSPATAQNTFEITIPVPGLTNVAGGQQLPDGGFVFGGELSDGLVVVRTDSTGGVLWTRALAEGANEEGLYGRSLAVAGDRIFMGGYAMGPGTNTRDGLLHVLDLDGNILAQRLIDVGQNSNAIHSINDVTGGTLIAGRASGAGSYDMLLQKTDQDGNITDSWSYGSSGWDWAYEAVHLANGGMALVGYGDGVGGPPPSAYLVRTDANGEEVWARGVDGNSADEGYTVMEDPGTGHLYLGGTTLGMGAPGTRGFITKFDADGTHVWTRVIGNAFDVIGIVASVPDRYAALLRAQNISGGHGSYDVLVLIFNGAGDLLSNQLYGSAASEYPVSLARTPNGLLITSYKSGGTSAIHAVLTDALGQGGCTGISVSPQWTTYTPTIFNHSSTLQSSQNVTGWNAPGAQPALTRNFVCCTYPVTAAYTVAAGPDLTYTFTNQSTGAGEATWTINGTVLTGDVVQYTFPSTGTFQACLSIAGICATDQVCEAVNVINTGLEELGTLPMQISPNPATDQVLVTFANAVQHVELIDAHGRLLRSWPVNGLPAMSLDLTGLPPGMHVLRTMTASGSSAQRLVIH
jgi:hypothetical protein